MRKKIKTTVLLGTMLAGLALTLPAFAQSIALNDLQNFTLEDLQPSNQGKAFDKNHWAYKTLQNISKNYGLLVGEPEKTFDTNAPISRNEAAIILINLMGKIQQQNVQLSEAEKVKIEILQQELGTEIEQIKSDVSALKGRVSNLEENNKKLWGFNYGEDFKITGGARAVYYGNFQAGNPSTPSDFSLPYSEVRLTGKLAKHLDYCALAVPTRNFTSSANGILDDLFVSTDIIPHHQVQLGQIWLPFGLEAPMYNMDIDFIEYSQISRNMGQGLDTGTQIIGDWGLVNYTAGVFNGNGQNTTDNNHGLGYAGQVNIKPFYKHPGLGDLLIGGSGLSRRTNTNNVRGIGGYVSYDIGKFGIKFEYMDVDGLNGSSQFEGRGYYTDLKYRFNDKLTLLTRFDEYSPSIHDGGMASYEYVFGTNYQLMDNVLLMANYTYADRRAPGSKDSSRLGLMTQVQF
jgi:opacity protein-like surface antigen